MPPYAENLELRELRLDTARALVAQAVGNQPPGPPLVSAAAHLQELIDTLCDLSMRDPLTGLLNRRHLLHVMESEIDRVARSGEAALLLLLDIDNFKCINDQHGHPAGDQVLRTVAQTLLDCTRPMDTLARYGGEEFALILPSCPASFGDSVAERLRSAVEASLVSLGPQRDLQVTVSIGGAFAMPWIRTTTQLWLNRADTQLYRAKHACRNRALIEALPDSTVSADEKGMLCDALFAAAAWDDGAETASRIALNDTLDAGACK